MCVRVSCQVDANNVHKFTQRIGSVSLGDDGMSKAIWHVNAALVEPPAIKELMKVSFPLILVSNTAIPNLPKPRIVYHKSLGVQGRIALATELGADLEEAAILAKVYGADLRQLTIAAKFTKTDLSDNTKHAYFDTLQALAGNGGEPPVGWLEHNVGRGLPEAKINQLADFYNDLCIVNIIDKKDELVDHASMLAASVNVNKLTGYRQDLEAPPHQNIKPSPTTRCSKS